MNDLNLHWLYVSYHNEAILNTGSFRCFVQGCPPGKVITHLIVPVVLLPPHEVSICVYKLKVAPGQVDTLDIEKEKEIIGEQEIVYDEFVEEADMEDVENEDDDAAEELFYLCQLDKSLTPNSM